MSSTPATCRPSQTHLVFSFSARSVYPATMSFRLDVLLLAALAGCANRTDAQYPLNYLVTPAGVMFRIRGMGPVIGGEGKKIGTKVVYVGESPEIDRIIADAERIAAALGPELEVAGESALMVQADVGYDPRKTISSYPSYTVVFQLGAGRWTRLPSKDPSSKPLEVEGSFKPADDPAFPFDKSKTSSAANAAARWVAALDEGDADGSVAAMAPAFRSETLGRIATWREKLTQRNALGVAGHRAELYRMQTVLKGECPLKAASSSSTRSVHSLVDDSSSV